MYKSKTQHMYIQFNFFREFQKGNTICYSFFNLQLCSFIGFICIEASGLASHTRGGFFNFVALVAVFFTGILLIFYLFHIIEKTFRIPWLMVEFTFCAIWTFGFLSVSIMAATYGSDAYLVAAVSKNLYTYCWN